MTYEVRPPEEIWGDEPEGGLAQWLYPDGAAVAAGDIVGEVMVGKTQYEVAAPTSGILNHMIALGGVVRQGDVIAKISGVDP